MSDITTYGDFRYDESRQKLEGPADYMDERGDRIVKRVMRRPDTIVWALGKQHGGDFMVGLLARLQNDYLAWEHAGAGQKLMSLN